MSIRHAPVLALAFVLAGCGRETAPAAAAPDALTLALAPAGGDTRLDRDIASQQDSVRTSPRKPEALERLGTLFIAKARRRQDPGAYKLAEQCALAIEQSEPNSAAAKLLRGHVQQSLHAFAAAEATARALVAQRGIMHDWGLLGDVLVDRGDVREALACYQKMLDQKPCLQSYTRAAHARWLRGDLDGSRQLLRLATGAGSSRDPESLSWTWARLALLELQSKDFDAADRACTSALTLLPENAAALHVLGRLRLAQGRITDALAPLQNAAERNPLPEHRWLLADALRSAGRVSEAQVVERALETDGAKEDPRSFALYLATRGTRAADAVLLVEQELAARSDVHSHDAHAWALLAAGRTQEARAAATRALAEGTQDARLLLHAGIVALATGDRDDARARLRAAETLQHVLYPSEREALVRALTTL